MLRHLIGGLFLLLGLATPALADGIELPKTIRPTPGGTYVVRAVITTTNAVQDLQYNVFNVAADGRIGDAVDGVTLRPAQLNTQPGVKRRILVVVPGQAIKQEQLLSLCMWKEPPQATGTQSQLLAFFRYCKLFQAKP